MSGRLRPPRLWSALLLYPLALASLMVAAGGGVMWVRSHRVAERWRHATTEADGPDLKFHDVSFWSAKGGVGMYVQNYWNLANPTRGWPWFHSTDSVMMMYPYQAVSAKGVPETRWHVGDFTYFRSDRASGDLWMEMDGTRYPLAKRMEEHTVVVPWWSFVAAGLIVPALAARRYRRGRRWRRRARAGLCARCGYDLRATPGRCPECGAVAEVAA